MPEAGLADLASLCTVELVLLVPALLVALLVNHRAREAVGEPFAVERSRRARFLRLSVPVAALAVLFAWCAVEPGADTRFAALQPAFDCLALAALVAWSSPVEADRVVGASGVQLGWRAWRWEELAGARVERDAVCIPLEGGERRVPLAPAAAEALRSALAGARSA